MRYLILQLLIFVPIFCFSQLKTRDFNPNITLEFDVELLGNKSYSKGLLSQELSLFYEEDKATMYLLGELDAGRHYTSYSSFGASFFSSFLFPPAGLITSVALSFSPPKDKNFGLPKDKLPLLLDTNYYKGYSQESKKKKILRAWGGFATGTAFFYAGLRMFGYNLEDYLFK